MDASRHRSGNAPIQECGWKQGESAVGQNSEVTLFENDASGLNPAHSISSPCRRCSTGTIPLLLSGCRAGRSPKIKQLPHLPIHASRQLLQHLESQRVEAAFNQAEKIYARYK